MYGLVFGLPEESNTQLESIDIINNSKEPLDELLQISHGCNNYVIHCFARRFGVYHYISGHDWKHNDIHQISEQNNGLHNYYNRVRFEEAHLRVLCCC